MTCPCTRSEQLERELELYKQAHEATTERLNERNHFIQQLQAILQDGDAIVDGLRSELEEATAACAEAREHIQRLEAVRKPSTPVQSTPGTLTVTCMRVVRHRATITDIEPDRLGDIKQTGEVIEINGVPGNHYCTEHAEVGWYHCQSCPCKGCGRPRPDCECIPF